MSVPDPMSSSMAVRTLTSVKRRRPRGRPRARARVSRIVITVSADALDQRVAEPLDALGKVVVAAGGPVRPVGAGHGVGARKRDEQDVVRVVAAPAGHAAAEACRGQRDGRLADEGLVVVVAVLVAPDTVYLDGVKIKKKGYHGIAEL